MSLDEGQVPDDNVPGRSPPGGPPAAGTRTYRIPLTLMEAHPCVYLPDRQAQMRGVWAGHLMRPSGHERSLSDSKQSSGVPDDLFETMLNSGFRRSGDVIYQPTCAGCSACLPLRISVEQFHPSKSQRRIARKNIDLQVSIGQPTFSAEKSELYARYLAGQHTPPVGEDVESQAESLETFLYASPVTTAEVTYRDTNEKLVAVGICDITQNVFSSVYFYWDPAETHRSLGVFGALTEIEIARLQGRAWYHLGYWVKGAKTMDYKAGIADHELLRAGEEWVRTPRSKGGGGGV